MKKIIIFLVFTLTTTLYGWSQDGSSIAMPYMAIDRNATTSVLGGARITDVLYNPAAIPFVGSDVQVSYQLWAPKNNKSNHINVLSGIKIGNKFGLSVHGAFQLGTPYNTFDLSGKMGDTFTPKDLLLGIGAGFAFTPFLSAGVNLNFSNQKVSADASYSAFAADIFLLFKKDGLRASAGVANLGTRVKAGETTFPIPSSAKLGASYTLPFGLGFAADFDYYFAGGIAICAGAQYTWKDIVFVRAGYHFEDKKSPLPSYASIGIGGKFFGIHLDVSYLTASAALGNTLTIGLGYSF